MVYTDEPMSPPEPALRILAVDDHETVIPVVRRMLKKLGYEVVATRSPREALAVLSDLDVAIALLLTDVRMPELSGLELAERARELRPELPIVFMSGYDDFGGRPTPFGEPLLTKPFSLRNLVQTIEARLAEEEKTPTSRRSGA